MSKLTAPTETVANPQRGPLLRLFTSVWFGVTLLTLILAYACIFSAMPQVRGALELTEMAAFSHWLFTALVCLFCVTLATVTWVRIRWNVKNAGVLTVHTGLLLLTGGSIWYFGTKIEGDVLLLSPRIELLTADGKELRGGAILAEKGQRWANVMPALGGRVELEVLETRGAGVEPVVSADVKVSVGGAAPETITLSTADGGVKRINERLNVRLTPATVERTFYDRFVAALYFGAAGEDMQQAPLSALPLHRERYLAGEGVIRDANGRESTSKRDWPHVKLAGVTIPTGWFELWRMPLKVETPGLPFDVQITGYLPYVRGFESIAAEGGPELNPAVNLRFAISGRDEDVVLFARDPRDSIVLDQSGLGVEYLWAESEAQKEEWQKPLAGPHELTIEIKDPPVSQTLAVEAGQKISVPGTTYELTIDQLLPDWPLMTPGFEDARSPVARVRVTNGEKSYDRTVVQRFPQLSQDIDEQGMRRREEPYDPNLVLRYRTSAAGWIRIIGGPTAESGQVVAVWDMRGAVRIHTPQLGEPIQVSPGLGMKIASAPVRAQRTAVPVVEPLETRRPDVERQKSAIRVRLTGRKEHAGWSQSLWLPFFSYPTVDATPTVVRGPEGGREYRLLYSRQEHALDGEVALRRLQVNFFPGRRSAESWHSYFVTAAYKSDAERVPAHLRRSRSDLFAGAPATAEVYTNQTHTFGRWTFFQSGAPSNDDWSWSALGVGNREGIWTMVLGCILVPLGCIYAFYVKPVIVRRRKAEALAEASRRGALGRKAAVETTSEDLVEVGS